ncbi:MAG: ECF-type sigma factor [Acidobacteriota bacterium]
MSRVLRDAANNPDAIDDIFPRVYEELRSMAGQSLRHERQDHTLSATALVHEAYLRLSASDPTRLRGRRHFFAAAAVAMRRVLVDHARRQLAAKRIPRRQIEPLDDDQPLVSIVDPNLLALDQALFALGEVDPRMVRIVELKYFAGLSEQQAAEVLGVSNKTVRRAWAAARVWLHRKMTQ